MVQTMDDRVSILTVNGAGHFVPQDRAGPALQMLYNFVHNSTNYTLPIENINVEAAPMISQAMAENTGYLDGGNIDMLGLDGANHSMFHWFNPYSGNVTSNGTPVLVWFTGGPGCSSLGAMLAENGPVRVNKDGKTFYEDRYAWTKVGHVVYIESPAGVGFSYTKFPNGTVTNNLTWSDYATQQLNLNVLKSFFAKYPDLAQNPWFITGESYAGV